MKIKRVCIRSFQDLQSPERVNFSDYAGKGVSCDDADGAEKGEIALKGGGRGRFLVYIYIYLYNRSAG